MKVFIVLGDQGGSGFYRMLEPARVARERGVEIEVSENGDVPCIAGRKTDGTYVVQELRIDADVIVFQRPLPQVHYALTLAAKRQGMAVVADIDDDFHNVHHQNVAAIATNIRQSPLENRRWLMKTLELCDVVTVSTPALLKYAKGFTKGIIVRNRIPERILDLPRRPLCGRIGWTGTVTTHPEDMQMARGVLDQVTTPMAIVGDTTGVAQALGLPANRVELAMGWHPKVPIYWRALNASMDVGIVPLESSTFNNSKSALKGLEYIALGKPFIASPLPEYQKLVTDSRAGVIAKGPRQWASAARELLEDGEAFRTAGKYWIRENTLEKHIDDWINSWALAKEVNEDAKLRGRAHP